jgi:hypothetical protein
MLQAVFRILIRTGSGFRKKTRLTRKEKISWFEELDALHKKAEGFPQLGILQEGLRIYYNFYF